jgi:TetR/AcrR family transcriptional regulator, repressor of fatR-cypB operon
VVNSPKGLSAAILDAALELFAERGFYGTAMPLVAEKAGVGAGTLYRHFASKEALANALFQKWKIALGVSLSQVPVDLPVRQQFHRLWVNFVQFSRMHPKAFAFLELHHHASYLDADSRQVEDSVLSPLVDVVRKAQQEMAVKDVDPAVLIALIYGSIVGLVRGEERGAGTLTERSLADAEECMWQAIRR